MKAVKKAADCETVRCLSMCHFLNIFLIFKIIVIFYVNHWKKKEKWFTIKT